MEALTTLTTRQTGGKRRGQRGREVTNGGTSRIRKSQMCTSSPIPCPALPQSARRQAACGRYTLISW